MGRKVTLSVCTLHQWALDFEGNFQRIVKGINEAKKQKSKFCLFPELCIPGYGCSDHFFENDTILHSFQMLEKLLVLPEMMNMLCDVGMPVLHKNVLYNCRIIFTYKKIILIRPKKDMANDDCYRELRWFTPWKRHSIVEDHFLPRMIQSITEQETAPFGDGVVATEDTCIGSEVCEELWTPVQTISQQSIDGVEVFTNGSGSHHELHKGYRRSQMIQSATYQCGGVYLFSNQQGCDGDRVCYDGFSLIAVNGSIVAQGSQFALEDVECMSATVDLEDVRSYRAAKSSRGLQAEMKQYSFPRFKVKDFTLSPDSFRDNLMLPCVQPITLKIHTVEEEIALGPACWLWDYLRRSGMAGFFLPLSGGVDSASVACIVFSMCKEVFISIENGNLTALKDLRRIVQDHEYYPEGTRDICNRIFVTCYMGSDNSSVETKTRAAALAKCIGSNHVTSLIDVAVTAFVKIFTTMTGMTPKFKVNSGSHAENIALQNIQARVRMVLAYLLAGLLPWSHGKSGSLLVLGSSNVDECLRGYFTKYDCSSADLNPIGSISKRDLTSFLGYAYRNYGFKPLKEIMNSPPTAELEPLANGALAQTDEADMGMTYDELSVFGHLRKLEFCGPYSMFCKLLHTWKNQHTPTQISTKVKYFFKMYGINRHKMTTLTPAYHAAGYSPDDNRYDQRQFLYSSQWTWQFQAIDDAIKSIEDHPNSSGSEVD